LKLNFIRITYTYGGLTLISLIMRSAKSLNRISRSYNKELDQKFNLSYNMKYSLLISIHLRHHLSELYSQDFHLELAMLLWVAQYACKV